MVLKGTSLQLPMDQSQWYTIESKKPDAKESILHDFTGFGGEPEWTGVCNTCRQDRKLDDRRGRTRTDWALCRHTGTIKDNLGPLRTKPYLYLFSYPLPWSHTYTWTRTGRSWKRKSGEPEEATGLASAPLPTRGTSRSALEWQWLVSSRDFHSRRPTLFIPAFQILSKFLLGPNPNLEF